MVFMLISYKKALFCWSIFSLAMHIGVCLRFAPPAVSLLFAVNISFLFLAFLKGKCNSKFIYKRYLVLYILSAMITVSQFLENSQTEIVGTANVVINTFAIIYLLEKEIRSINDVTMICRILYVFIGVSVFYGIFVVITAYNPIIDYELSLIPPGMENKLVSSTETLRGVKAQSYFAGATQFATFVFLTSVIFLSANCKGTSNNFSQKVFVLFLAISICFLSKTRASIFAGMLAILYFMYKQKSVNTIRLLIIILLLSPVIVSLLGDNMSFITSIYDQKAQDEVGGSSAEMRAVQLGAVIQVASISPLFGIGITGFSNLSASVMDDILGAESVWFQLAITRGLVGILIYGYLFYFSVKSVSKNMRIYVIMSSLFWLTLHTLSTTGLSEYFYMFTFIIIKKLDNIKYKINEKDSSNNLPCIR